MKFGLDDQQFNTVLNNVVHPLEMLGAKVYCFGSRARGDYRPFSDLDIMVKGEEKALPSKVSLIREKMINSNFPYKIDIVLFSEFAESFKEGYQKEKKAFALDR